MKLLLNFNIFIGIKEGDLGLIISIISIYMINQASLKGQNYMVVYYSGSL